MLRVVYSFLFLMVCQGVECQDLNYVKKTLQVERFKSLVIFDGLSDEEAWSEAFQMDFTTYRPVWGGAPSEKTEMLVGFDDEFLYVAGRCYTRDSSSLVIRNLVRDGWRGDDWMTFHIDNTFDQQNALIFSIYPMGSRYDAAIGNDGVDLGVASFNENFNMFWDARSVVRKEGWFFEMRIPLFNLRLRKNAEGHVMAGISAARILQNPQEMHIFPAIPQNIQEGMSKPSVKQPVVLSDIQPQKLFLLTPYVAGSAQRNHAFNSTNNTYRTQSDRTAQAGLDVKAGVSPHLTLDVSLNPDFAQVEADDQLLNLTRFSLFFPERRLFFQESAGLFDVNLGGQTQMFYSRQIGINDGQLTQVFGGARLTGKLNKNTDIGFLSMQTAPLRNQADSVIRSSENFTTLRMRRKILNAQSFMGFVTTQRWIENRLNTGLGVDMMLNPSGDHYLIGALAHTIDHQQPLTPTATRLNLRYEKRQTDGVFGDLVYTYSGKDFNPVSGFLDRSDFHQWKGGISWGRFASTNSHRYQYIRWRILEADTYLSDTRREWETVDLATRLSLTRFKGQESTFEVRYNYEFLQEHLNFSDRIKVNPGTYQFAQLSYQYLEPRARAYRNFVTMSAGTFFGGQRINLSYNPILNLGKHWEIQALYSVNHLRFAENNQTIHIGRVRLNFALDLHFSVNYVVQYNSVNQQIFNNLRLRYNFSDGHDLFLVWNENFFTERAEAWGGIRPVSGVQNVIVKYNVTFDAFKMKKKILHSFGKGV